ncbi:hypothetical protein TSUD_357100 [Trifolium subterraneum]|uniref:Uncharacterized protein n=1 Tax=Trifolium subterraneum TaxID=3900 RepID=A0A2Z6MR76_TRISU|nr:hypothetical protein TSUD_357100 [Trifolium subterraneum]
MDYESKEVDATTLRTMSFKSERNIDELYNQQGLDEEAIVEESTCSKRRKIGNLKLQTTFSFKYLVTDNSDSKQDKPQIWFSPKSIGELDVAAIKLQKLFVRSYVKSETALSKWARARTMAAKIDPRHRYGHNLHLYYNVWFHSQSSQPFFYW